MSFPVFLAQIQAEKTLNDQSIFGLILHSDPLVKVTLLILAVFSVGSWAIIFYKFKQLKAAQSTSQGFWASFSQANSFNDVLEKRADKSGPLYEMFRAAVDGLSRFKKGGRKDSLLNRLTQTREEEIYKLEQYMPFLATTASTAPFVGLFGTVWGILTAFWAIGRAGSSSLATVGPYISEALVTTAIGLATAIPAVVAYNYFTYRIKILIKMMDLFTDDLVVRIDGEIGS